MDNIDSYVLEIINGSSLFLLESSVTGTSNKHVSVLIDSEMGITIDECADIARELGELLEARDVFNTPYILEVSSPGVGYPLTTAEQFKRNIGRRVEITLNEDEGELKSPVLADLTAVDENSITADIILPSKNPKNKQVRIEKGNIVPLSNIKEIKVRATL